jgi:hypothetical protein
VTLGTVQVQPGGAPPAGWRPPHAVDRPVAPGLTLAGYDLPRTSVRAGDALDVNLFWRVDGPPQAAPTLQAGGQSWPERGLAGLLPVAQWPAGIVEDRRQLIVPPATRAGIVPISLAGLMLGEVAVSEPRREFSLPPMQTRLDLPVGDFATLAGWTIEPLQPGQPLRLTLVWQDQQPAGASYKVFVHVLDASNQVIAQRDDLPQAGAMPTTFWLPGQVIADRYEVPLSGPPPAGAQLEVGMYEPNSGQRLKIGPDDHVLLPLNR